MQPQRPEDSQSTCNPGGNKLGGTDAGHNDPMAYLKTTSDHAYLGHFTGRKVLKDGHNFAAETIGRGRVRRILRREARSLAVGGVPEARTAARAAAIRAERPVTTARFERWMAVKAARQSGAPGAVREARQAGRAAIQAARANPESHRSEMRARRQARRGSTYARG